MWLTPLRTAVVEVGVTASLTAKTGGRRRISADGGRDPTEFEYRMNSGGLLRTLIRRPL